MLDILIEPAKILIEKGVDFYEKTKEHQNITLMVQDKILRELRFNAEVISILIKEENISEKEIQISLRRTLKTEAFDALEGGSFPLKILFNRKLDDDDWMYISDKEQWSKYKQRIKGIETQSQLLERTYHRLKIQKILSENKIVHGDIGYIRYLMLSLKKSIEKNHKI